MSALKTLPIADEPRVLLIGAEPWLISQVSLLFAPHQITVVALSAKDFLEVDVQKIELESVYKLIWWVEFVDQDHQQRVLGKLRQLTQVPTMVLGSLPEQFLLEHEALLPELKTAHQFFEAVLAALPEAQFFFGRDWFEVGEPTGLLKLSLRSLNDGLLFDPEMDWFLSSRESFFEVISPYCIRPHSPTRVIVKGRKTMSTVILRRLAGFYTRYYQTNLTIVPVGAVRHSPSTLGFVEVAYPVAIDALLDEFVRRKHQWQSLLTPPPPVSELIKKPAPPIKAEPVLQLPAMRLKAQAAKKQEKVKKVLVNREKERSEVKQAEQIEGELARIFRDNRTEKSEKRIDDKVKIVKKIAKKSRKNKALFYAGLATMALGGIVLFLWGIFAVTTVFARKEISAFLADGLTVEQVYHSGPWSQLLQFQVGYYQRLVGPEILSEGGELAEFEQTLLGLQQEMKRLDFLSEQYFLGILGQGETSAEFPPELAAQLVITQRRLSEMILAVESLGQFQVKESERWLTALKDEQQQLAILTQFPEVFTGVFGGGGKKIYAVLLENNLELRPSGGFIQAVAFLTFDRGLLTDSQVVNVYDLDNRLPGAVQAPAEIQRYLGESNWYLRDSNWNPDFKLAAQQAAWFIQQATGVRVDGVWALNYQALQVMLAALGPMELPVYDEVLTSDNVLERVEFHSDDELVGAGQPKKEYAVAVFSQLLRQLQVIPFEKAGQVLTALAEGLENKQILLSFAATDLQEAMRKLEWSGEVINPVCPTQFSPLTCLVDQVFQVEANISLNRVNAYVRREVRHDIDLGGEKVTHTRTITLKNNAPSQGWPLGTYKAYFRFVLDEEAQPTGAAVNGKKLAGESLAVYSERGRKVVGVPVAVPPQGTATLELSYVTETVPVGPFSYLLFDQKQAGGANTPITITFYNPDHEPTLIAPTAKVYDNSLEFSLTQTDHLFVGASFQ